MEFNKNKLNAMADYQARRELKTIVGDSNISDDTEEKIPDEYEKIWLMLKDMYIKGYMTCMKSVIHAMILEDE